MRKAKVSQKGLEEEHFLLIPSGRFASSGEQPLNPPPPLSVSGVNAEKESKVPSLCWGCYFDVLQGSYVFFSPFPSVTGICRNGVKRYQISSQKTSCLRLYGFVLQSIRVCICARHLIGLLQRTVTVLCPARHTSNARMQSWWTRLRGDIYQRCVAYPVPLPMVLVVESFGERTWTLMRRRCKWKKMTVGAFPSFANFFRTRQFHHFLFCCCNLLLE